MTADPWIGKEVGRYRIERFVGRGGMGVVYRGVQRSLNRPVGIKILPPDAAQDQEFVRRFHQEAKAIAGLAHENIVYVYDIEEHEGTTYIVMEFIDGESLTGSGPLPVEEVRRVGIGVARALSHAHQRGIVHRDVKSANVMRTRDGRVKLMDFGVARVEGGIKTRTGLLHGTPAYMAPEQIQRGDVSPRTDLYSLGVLLYELATGRLPWDVSGGIAAALQSLMTDPPSPRALRRDLPEWLEAVILKAMSRKPEERFASAAEVEQALVRAGAASVDATSSTDYARPVPARLAPPPLPAAAPPAPPPPAEHPTAPTVVPMPPASLDSAPTLVTDPAPRGRLPLILAGAFLLAAAVTAVALLLPGSKSQSPSGGAGPGPGGAAPSTAIVEVPPPAPAAAASPTEKPEKPEEPAPLAPETLTVVELAPTPEPAVTPEPSPRPRPAPKVSAARPKESVPDVLAGTFRCRRGAEFNVSPEEAWVTIDGVRIGTADDWDGKGGGRTYLFPGPGVHYARFDLTGYETAWVKIVVAADAEDEVADVDTELSRARRFLPPD